MNADPHAEIALADIGEICERLHKEATPTAHILTAPLPPVLRSSATVSAKRGKGFASLLDDPAYRSSQRPHPA